MAAFEISTITILVQSLTVIDLKHVKPNQVRQAADLTFISSLSSSFPEFGKTPVHENHLTARWPAHTPSVLPHLQLSTQLLADGESTHDTERGFWRRKLKGSKLHIQRLPCAVSCQAEFSPSHPAVRLFGLL